MNNAIDDPFCSDEDCEENDGHDNDANNEIEDIANLNTLYTQAHSKVNT